MNQQTEYQLALVAEHVERMKTNGELVDKGHYKAWVGGIKNYYSVCFAKTTLVLGGLHG